VITDILLTGANGQVGWEVARRAAALGISVSPLIHADLDITNNKAVHSKVASVNPKVVINAAAYTAVDRAETDKDAAFAVNRDGAGHLAGVCAVREIPLIHLSTDYVFNGKKKTPYVEEDATNPLGVYGESKLAGECAVRALLARHVIVRTSWVYGVHGHNFVKTMLRLGRERNQIRVVDDQIGSPTFAGDLADALLALSLRLRTDSVPGEAFGTFHCAGAGAVTWCDFARRIFEIAAPALGKQPEVEAIATTDYPTPAARPANSVLDCGKLSAVHGIMLRPWDAALQDMLKATLTVG
jgi:dTDP-4-dehydrorhamnose reductase